MDDPASAVANIRQQEEALLSPEGRGDQAFLSQVLADDFREFGASGMIYSKAATLQCLRMESMSRRKMEQFSACFIGEQAILATYRVWRTGQGEPATLSLRSSIWVDRSGQWQMIFHQGTTTRVQ